MRRSKLVLVDAGLFCIGMRVKAKLYFRNRNTYVLLCRDVVFTEELLVRLRQAAVADHGVYIEERDYEEIWNASLHQYALEAESYERAYQRVQREYSAIVTHTVTLLGAASSGQAIPLVTAEEVSGSIARELTHTELPLLLSCVNMIQRADDYLYTHSVNVATLNGMLGKWLDLPEGQVQLLIKIGLLHDLGKLQVDSKILNKPSRLTPEEFEHVKRHAGYSYEMLRISGETDPDVLLGVWQHHEKVNGLGYPMGLRGEDISLAARVTSVSDVYDAMVSKRCYKDPVTPFEVLAQFKENRYSDLDLQLVNTFLDNITFLLIGMRVRLSSGEEGEVVFVRPTDYANPVVRVGGRIVTTDEHCRCVVALAQE